jgi:hypothetical protein
MAGLIIQSSDRPAGRCRGRTVQRQGAAHQPLPARSVYCTFACWSGALL